MNIKSQMPSHWYASPTNNPALPEAEAANALVSLLDAYIPEPEDGEKVEEDIEV